MFGRSTLQRVFFEKVRQQDAAELLLEYGLVAEHFEAATDEGRKQNSGEFGIAEVSEGQKTQLLEYRGRLTALDDQLVVGVEEGEVADAEDDFVQEKIVTAAVAIPEQVAGNVSKLQGRPLLAETRLGNEFPLKPWHETDSKSELLRKKQRKTKPETWTRRDAQPG